MYLYKLGNITKLLHIIVWENSISVGKYWSIKKQKEYYTKFTFFFVSLLVNQ